MLRAGAVAVRAGRGRRRRARGAPCRGPARSAAPREIAAAQTLSGPHRDDLCIGAGPADLRREGSQGEQRTAALALLLAARDHLRARAARPILLLDDVLSELDPRRRRLLLEAVRDGGQTIVTTADPAAADALAEPPDALVRVEDGRLAADRHPRRRRRRRDPMGAADVLGRFRRRPAGAAGAGGAGAAAELAWRDVVGPRGGRPQRAGAPQPRRGAHGGVLERRVGARAHRCGATSWCACSPSAAPDAGVTGLRFAVADHVPAAEPPPPPPAPAPVPGPRGARAVGDAAAAGIARPGAARAGRAGRRGAGGAQERPRDGAKYLQIRQKWRAFRPGGC